MTIIYLFSMWLCIVQWANTHTHKWGGMLFNSSSSSSPPLFTIKELSRVRWTREKKKSGRKYACTFKTYIYLVSLNNGVFIRRRLNSVALNNVLDLIRAASCSGTHNSSVCSSACLGNADNIFHQPTAKTSQQCRICPFHPELEMCASQRYMEWNAV